MQCLLAWLHGMDTVVMWDGRGHCALTCEEGDRRGGGGGGGGRIQGRVQVQEERGGRQAAAVREEGAGADGWAGGGGATHAVEGL